MTWLLCGPGTVLTTDTWASNGKDMKTDDVAYVKYGGVKISNISYQDVLDTVTRTIGDERRGYICLTDVSNLIVATENESLRAAINDSLFSLADGMPLVWYARMVGCRDIERISGASLMQRLLSDMGGYRHYLLGDTEKTIAKVIAKAHELSDQIVINGHSPPFKDFDEEDNRCMLEKIRAAKPDVIWVCFGGHKQEKWMKENLDRLDKGVMIGVGAAFRFLVGDITTPPLIVQKLGMQWLFRITEAFVKDPVNCIKTVRKRQILTSKIAYLWNLPTEVFSARKTFKTGHD